MTPWRAMITAPLLAVAIIIIGINAPNVIAWVQALPGIGPFFQRTIHPGASTALLFLGVLCPAVPALIAVGFYQAVIQLFRDWKAQRLRAQRKAAWLQSTRTAGTAVNEVLERKAAIDKCRKTI
jgi:polyferredoxin